MERFPKDNHGPIAVFDSGYGGLTILNSLRNKLPQYDYIYLGDNARAPYGTRSLELVLEFTHEAVEKLFEMGCPLIILGCNTASAKALRSIQMNYLPVAAPDRRVLGVIRPTAEIVGELTETGHVGVLATEGTINSHSYRMEIGKLFPSLEVTGQACPMWVSIVENNEYDKPGADYFVKDSIDKLLNKDPKIDTVILGCTHFPLLLNKIKQYTPEGIRLIPQGKYVAESLADYLQRHGDMEQRLTKGGECRYYTTESPEKFKESATAFLKENINVEHLSLRKADN